MRPLSVPLKVLVTLLGTTTLVASAWATTYAFTSNSEADYGRKLVVGNKGLLQVPCVSAESDVVWAPGGTTLGIAVSTSADPIVWASGHSDEADAAGCGAGVGEHCRGAAYYDLSTSTVGQVWDPLEWPVEPGPVADVVGQGSSTRRVAVAHKELGEWLSITSGGTVSYGSANEPSQLHALDTTWAVGTEAGRLSCATPTGASEYGRVRLMKWGSTGYSSQALVSETDAFKPEGVYVREVAYSIACPYDAVAYVTDYCGATGSDGRVLVYGVETGTTPALVEEDRLTLPTGCNPSTVTWHEPSGKLFVLCQSGESIVPVTLNNACDLGAVGTEEPLKYVPSGAPAPSCTSSPTLTSCVGAGTANCSPHDFAWLDDPAWLDDWLLVTLDNANQIIAVSTTTPSVQAGFHGKHGTPSSYEPKEVELVNY